LLKDLFQEGIFGKTSVEKIHGANITMGAVDKRFIYNRDKKTTNKAVRLSVVSSLFPSVEYMKQNFSHLNKIGYLLPFVYCQSILAY
jgi:hypothetical protein